MISRQSEEALFTALRADMYQLLAAGFLHPDRELAAALADGSFAADVADTAGALEKELGLEGGDAQVLLDPVRALANNVSGTTDAEALYHELAVEYARLFIGPPTPAVSPYESIHVDSEPGSPALLMVSPSARAVMAAYREAGLSMAEGMNEPPDHIATEFEFMYYLCAKEAAGLQGEADAEAARDPQGDGDAAPDAPEWRTLQGAFIAQHLGVWVPEFARSVSAGTTHEFYRSLSELAAAFVQLELKECAAGTGSR